MVVYKTAICQSTYFWDTFYITMQLQLISCLLQTRDNLNNVMPGYDTQICEEKPYSATGSIFHIRKFHKEYGFPFMLRRVHL